MKKQITAAVVCGAMFLPSIANATEASSMRQSRVRATNDVRDIKVTVIDSKTKDPVIGAAILNETTRQGNATDFDGIGIIKASKGEKLQISYLGYISQVITIGSEKVITISLKEDTEQLEEVVVTAFGTGQKKESIVGSIQTVRPEQLRVPSANISNAFAGRMAGVVAYQRSGQPGSNASDFFIRGISTLSGVTSPLIILDGVEISSADLNALDPEVIEGFSILKDATATAMYGTRGANGVMIVTTKKGLAVDKPIIGFRIESYINQPTEIPEFVDGPTYMGLYNEAVTQQGTGDILFTADEIANTRLGLDPYIYPNVDWYNEVFKTTTFNQKANFNIRGGSERLTYFMNVGAVHETGMLKDRTSEFYSYKNNIDFYRYTFQNNIDFHMSKSSTIALHLNVNLTDKRAPSVDVKDIYGSIMNSNPVDFPVRYPSDGAANWIYWGAFTGGNDQGAKNPLAEMTRGYTDQFASTVIANLTFDQKLDMITKGLSFKALFSFKNWNETNNTRSAGYNKYTLANWSEGPDGNIIYNLTPIGSPERHVLKSSSKVNGDRRFYYQALLNYDRMFGSHSLNAMALFNGEQFDRNVPGDDLIKSLPNRKLGLAGRITYSYDSRYMLEINAGYNGSENFAKGNRWGFFPSVAIGWTVSQENFFQPLSNVVSYMKLRGSYGFVGNDQISNARFIYLSDIELQGTSDFKTGYGNNTTSHKGPKYKRYQNDNITWEVGEKMNAGVDIQLFNTLNINFDVFQEIRSNIFQERYSIPNYLGVAGTKVYGNLAKVKNWGFDGSFDIGKQFNQDFSLQFKGTFTFARNRVLEYDEAPGLRPALSQVGRSLNVHMGYISNGLYLDYADIANNPSSTIGNIAIGPGDIKYVDQPDANGEYDGKITTDDKRPLGFPTVPEIVYGFGPSMRYKNIDFSFFFQGAANTSIIMESFHPFGTQYNRNVLSFVAEDRWSEHNQNPDAAYPRLTRYDNNHNQAKSDFWLRNGAFLKLKNAEIGYNFKKARLYVSGTNLLTFSPFKHWDPEMGGGAGLKYPTQRTYNVGVQVTFR